MLVYNLGLTAVLRLQMHEQEQALYLEVGSVVVAEADDKLLTNRHWDVQGRLHCMKQRFVSECI